MAGRNEADAVLNAGSDDVTNQPARAQRNRGPVLRLAGTLVVLSLLGACSSVPDTLDPTTWYGSSKDEAAKAGEGEQKSDLQAERGEVPPGADADYPTLGSVDRKEAARDNMQGGLVADPQAPQYAAAIPRQGESAAPKEPPQPTPQPNGTAPDVAPAPPSQPVLPVTPVPQQESSAAPAAPAASEQAAAPATPKRDAPMPIAQPRAESENSVTVAAATPEPEAPIPSRAPSDNLSSVDSSGGIDQSEMAERMKQRLADIRARSSAQGSLMTSELQQAPDGGISTVVVSSAGVQQSSGEEHMAMLLPGAEQPMPPDARFVENRGALPLPTDSERVATILFDHGTARLTSRDRQILQDVVNLQRQRGGKLRIIGHASQRTGNMDIERHRQVNFRVSVSRASRIAQELKRMGVAQDDVLVAAVGDTQPVFFEFMPSGEAGNRRTEIYLSSN